MWNKDKIAHLLRTNDRAVEKAILCIYNRQTFDEQAESSTKHHNKIGFSAAHARVGTYYANWIISGKHLSGQHLATARKIALRYVGQLESEVRSKQAHQAT